MTLFEELMGLASELDESGVEYALVGGLMDPDAIEARLRRASDMSDLSADKRLDAKIDLSSEGIRARLIEASDLFEVCCALRAALPRRAAD